MLARLGRILLWILGGLVALALVLVVVGIVVLRGLIYPDTSRFGTVEDEARRAGRSVESLPGAGDPYYAAMDKGLLLPPAAGAAYPPEILDVAGDTQLDPEAVRQAAIREAADDRSLLRPGQVLGERPPLDEHAAVAW